LLLLLGVLIMAQLSAIVGLLLAALALLNLYLVYKLDMFSREEVYFAHELKVAKTREELLAAEKRIGEPEGGKAVGKAADLAGRRRERPASASVRSTALLS
jgi:hypothetical protein